MFKNIHMVVYPSCRRTLIFPNRVFGWGLRGYLEARESEGLPFLGFLIWNLGSKEEPIGEFHFSSPFMNQILPVLEKFGRKFKSTLSRPSLLFFLPFLFSIRPLLLRLLSANKTQWIPLECDRIMHSLIKFSHVLFDFAYWWLVTRFKVLF